MARVKRAVNAHKKRRVILERASGYRGQRSRLYRKAKEQVTHSLVYAYRDRRKRKGDFRLQLTRTLKEPGRHKVELYLFTPHETTLSPWTLAEKQFYFSSLTHSFGLLGLPTKDRASKVDSSFSLLSPHYEIMYGAWFFQYQASMGRLRQQLLAA